MLRRLLRVAAHEVRNIYYVLSTGNIRLGKAVLCVLGVLRG